MSSVFDNSSIQDDFAKARGNSTNLDSGILDNNPFASNPISSDTSTSLTGLGTISGPIPTPDVLNRGSVFGSAAQPIPNPGQCEVGDFLSTRVPNVLSAAKNILQTFAINPLDKFDNVAYHISLNMAPEAQVMDPTKPPKGPFYIIAESGVSANFYIKSVEIDSLVSANGQTKNTASTICRINIIEPQGVSFIDKILAAARTLGIQSPRTCPVIMEISFKGYSANGQPGVATIAKRSYRIVLANIKTQVNAGGSEYTIEAPIYQDFSFNRFSGAAFIKAPINVTLTTVGEFFDQLGQILTKQAESIAKQGQIPTETYKFAVDPTMTSWIIGDPAETKDTPSLHVDTKEGVRTATFDTNVTLDQIVDSVIAATKEGNEMINPASSPEKIDNNPEANQVSKIAWITGCVKLGNFITAANDYDKEYTYYITKHDTYRAIIDKPDLSNSARAQYMVTGALKKRYDYLFTGKNNSVLSLDLDFNALWIHAASYYSSALQRKNNIPVAKYVSSDSKTTQTDTPDDLRTDLENPFTAQPQAESSMTSSSGLNYNLSLSDNSQNPQFGTLTGKDQLSDTSGGTVSFAQSVTSARDASTPVPTQGLPSNVSSNIKENPLPWLVKDLNATNSTSPNAANSPVEGASEGTGSSSLPVLGDLGSRLSKVKDLFFGGTQGAQSNNLVETLPFNPTLDDPLQKYFTKQVDPQIDTTRITKHIEDTTDLGRSIFGVVTNQLYDSGGDANMLNVSLEIRGDPYWLGETTEEILARMPGLNPSTQTLTDNTNAYANYLKGENCFYLTFNTPAKYDERTGFVSPKESNMFVGVYVVNRITHSFADGKFTQKIDAIRDTQTNPALLSKFIG